MGVPNRLIPRRRLGDLEPVLARSTLSKVASWEAVGLNETYAVVSLANPCAPSPPVGSVKAAGTAVTLRTRISLWTDVVLGGGGCCQLM